MTPERWQQIKGVLGTALSLGDLDRRAYLEHTCAADPDLRTEVESLIDSHEHAGSGFLDSPGVTPPFAFVDSSPHRAGSRIGPYKLLDRVGRGGMGEVFCAVRADGEFEQTVALKLVRAGFATPILERFRAERQILATLDHPNIARLLDGGTTEDGAPYLVMELVDGVPIDAYCRAHNLSIPERLELFLRVCSAVQYAHQRLVIHRDIKPSNLLVTSEGVPKLVDFGIAKILDPIGRPEETMFRPFTPEYASPEQVRGEPVSTATDVYALGVVLYELLTSRSPYRLRTRTPDALCDAIKNRDPERPSTAMVSDEPNEAGRRAPAQRLSSQLRGDLDFILLKALRKEPDSRYATVDQFAADIGRHLEGHPVTARAGTWTYFAVKFVRRHRAGVAAALLVLLTLIAGLAVTLREARIAEANRRRAEARFNDVRRLATSLLFEVHDAVENLPGAIEARKLILQRSREYLDSLAKESGNEPDLVRELATAYGRVAQLEGNPFAMHVGDTAAALASFQKSIALRESLARANPAAHRDQIELAGAYLGYGEFLAGAADEVVRGVEYAKRALAILDREARTAPDDSRILDLTMQTLTTLGMLQTGNGLMGHAGSMRQGVADLERALLLTRGAIDRTTADARLRYREATIELAIGQALLMLGERPEASAHYRRSIDVFDAAARATYDPRVAINRAVAYEKMGDVLLIDGKTSQALPYYLKGQQLASRLVATDSHNETFRRQETIALVELGHAQVELGQADTGMRNIREAVAKIDADRTDIPLTRSIEALIRGWFGEALERQGRAREASHEYALAKERLGVLHTRGSNDPRVDGFLAAATVRLGAVLAKLDEPDNARRELEQARTLLEPLVKTYPDDLELAYVLAETYTAEGTIEAGRATRAVSASEKAPLLDSARGWFRRSVDVWSRVPHPARVSTSGFEVTLPAEISRRLAACDRALAFAGGSSHHQ